jgi:hypothetical protein
MSLKAITAVGLCVDCHTYHMPDDHGPDGYPPCACGVGLADHIGCLECAAPSCCARCTREHEQIQHSPLEREPRGDW